MRMAWRLRQLLWGGVPPNLEVRNHLGVGKWTVVFSRHRGSIVRLPTHAVRAGADFRNQSGISAALSEAGTRFGRVEVEPTSAGVDGFRADVWLVRSYEKHILIDLESQACLRRNKSQYTAEYVTLRKRFERHVNSPKFWADSSTSWLREDLVNGRRLSDLRSHEAIWTWTNVLTQLCSLSSNEFDPAADKGAPFSELLAATPLSLSHGTLGELNRLFGESHLQEVPSHGDLHEENVILNHDGAPVVVDLDEIALRPFWFDPLCIAACLPRRWEVGALDGPLAKIWSSVGVEPIRWTRREVGLARVALEVFRTSQAIHRIRGWIPAGRRWTIVRNAQARVVDIVASDESSPCRPQA